MSSKRDTASALAGILKAKRGEEAPPSPAPPPEPATVRIEPVEPPSPAPVPAPASEPTANQRKRSAPQGQTGKYRDPNYTQHSIYLRKGTQKKVRRELEDEETGQDFSELVQELLEQWLKSRT